MVADEAVERATAEPQEPESLDAGNGLHPDERHIVDSTSKLQIPGSVAAFFDTDSSSLNTYNKEVPSFVYDTVPIFLGKIGAAVSGPMGFGERDTYAGLYSVGRTLSGLADIGTLSGDEYKQGGHIVGGTPKVFAALVAVLPHWLSGGAAIPWQSLALTLGVVLVVGLLAGLAAVRATLRAELLPALREE